MTRAAELTAVNCTSCGAGLDILGGGRVTTHVCSYCGTMLDANQAYKAVKTFAELKRPDSPFQIGDTGQIGGVTYTVIGTLGLRETWHMRVWSWAEHLIYSETHGYAWLCVENNHVTFSRRVRDSIWLSSERVESSLSRPDVNFLEKKFEYYDTTIASTTFAEGEFTYRPEIGQTSTTVTVVNGGEMLEFTETEFEQELHLTTYLTRDEIKEGFGIHMPAPHRMHPLTPFKPWKHGDFLIQAGAVFAAIALLLGFALSISPGKTLFAQTYKFPEDFPITQTFEVTRPNQLVEIKLDSTIKGGWAYMNFEVTDPDDIVRFEVGRISEYYTGRDGTGPWVEDKSQASFKFHPNAAGEFTLSVEMEELGQWENNRSQRLVPMSPTPIIHSVNVRASEGHQSGLLPFILAGIFGLLAAVPLARRHFAKMQRWSGSDWTDED